MEPATLAHREDSPNTCANWPFYRVIYTEGNLALGDGAHPLGPCPVLHDRHTEGNTDRSKNGPNTPHFLEQKKWPKPLMVASLSKTQAHRTNYLFNKTW